MKHYLGVDIGTFETKGVIVSATGEIVAQAAQLGVHLQRRFDDSLLPVSSLAVFHATTADADARTFRLMAESANRLGVPASREFPFTLDLR